MYISEGRHVYACVHILRLAICESLRRRIMHCSELLTFPVTFHNQSLQYVNTHSKLYKTDRKMTKCKENVVKRTLAYDLFII